MILRIKIPPHSSLYPAYEYFIPSGHAIVVALMGMLEDRLDG